MFTEYALRNAPPYLSFRLAEKKDSAATRSSSFRAPGGRKKRALNAGNIIQSAKPCARISNSVRVWYKVHGESPRRPQCCLDRRPRAAGRGGEKSRSEVRLSVSGMRGSRPRLAALATTLVFPLDSPLLRGVQRTLPLVAFLWSTRTVSFRERKEMGLDYAGPSRRTGNSSTAMPCRRRNLFCLAPS